MQRATPIGDLLDAMQAYTHYKNDPTAFDRHLCRVRFYEKDMSHLRHGQMSARYIILSLILYLLSLLTEK